jgi:hypothetical protein
MNVLTDELINKMKWVVNTSFTAARDRQTDTGISDEFLLSYDFFLIN